MAITKQRQIGVLKSKLELYENTVWDAEFDVKIAATLKDETMAKNAKKRMKDAMKAITLLESEIAELEKEDDETLTSS